MRLGAAALALCLSAITAAGPNDIVFKYRDNEDASDQEAIPVHLTTGDGLMFYSLTFLGPRYASIGPGLTLSSGVLSATASAVTWATITGRPAWTSTFDGSFASLSAKPTTLAGYGITDAGTVTSVAAGTGLSGGTITTSGTISLPNVGTAGTYTSVTTDAQGRVTAGSSPTVGTPGTYSGVTTDAQGRVTAGTNRIFANPGRSLNSAFQISTTRDAQVVYTVDISVTSLLLAGTSGRVYLEYADNSGMSVNLVTVMSTPNATGGVLNVTNLGPGNVMGMVPASKWTRIRTQNVSGTPTYTFIGSQEVQL